MLPAERAVSQVPMTRAFTIVGASPIAITRSVSLTVALIESGCLRVQPKVGGKLHLRLNTNVKPIANKYREGKLQRTLKREFKRT